MNRTLSWADHRVFRGSGDALLFAVEDASLFSLSPDADEALCRWRDSKRIDPERLTPGEFEILQGLQDAQILHSQSRQAEAGNRPEPGQVPLSTLVLEVAQDCNLRCTYCYADGGSYGAARCLLDPAMARQAVRYFLEHSAGREHVTLIFFGGEPLLNLQAVAAATDEAKSYGGKLGKKVHFSITTNGTLLNAASVDFLHENRIAVAVSMDGPPDIHDCNRPDAAGHGSYAETASRLGMLLEGTPVPVAARVTLRPDQWHRAVEVFDHLTGLGFHEVGIAPVSPVNKTLLPSAGEEEALLDSFGLLARRFVHDAKSGRALPFANMLDLLGRLHLGQTKSMSCGAGYGYMAVDATGQLFPCHRMTGDPGFCIGSITSGVHAGQITSSLGSLNHGRMESCSRCWARKLCAGGCHYENHLRENRLGLPRGSSCRFIRSWLELGIRTYAELRSSGAIDTMSRRLAQRAQC